jgi:hypothetical protein
VPGLVLIWRSFWSCANAVAFGWAKLMMMMSLVGALFVQCERVVFLVNLGDVSFFKFFIDLTFI